MNLEIQKTSTEKQDVPVRLTKRGKAVLGIVGMGLAVSGTVAGVGANTPHFHSEHTATITEHTVTGIAKDNVKGADDHIQDTVQKIVDMNPKVFQDGKAYVESDDLGEAIVVPNSVDK